MQKTLSLVAAFFAVLLLREKQKNTLNLFVRFLHTLFPKNEQKTSEKNYRVCFPIHL